MFGEGCNGPVVRMGCEDSVSIFVSLSHKSMSWSGNPVTRGVAVGNNERSFMLKTRAETVNGYACSSFS